MPTCGPDNVRVMYNRPGIGASDYGWTTDSKAFFRIVTVIKKKLRDYSLIYCSSQRDDQYELTLMFFSIQELSTLHLLASFHFDFTFQRASKSVSEDQRLFSSKEKQTAGLLDLELCVLVCRQLYTVFPAPVFSFSPFSLGFSLSTLLMSPTGSLLCCNAKWQPACLLTSHTHAHAWPCPSWPSLCTDSRAAMACRPASKGLKKEAQGIIPTPGVYLDNTETWARLESHCSGANALRPLMEIIGLVPWDYFASLL